MIFLHNLDSLPSETRAIVDTNIFVYWVTDHPRFGDACEEVIRRVETGEITGIVPGIILNELLHRLMIAETITNGHAGNVQDALKV